MTSTPLLNDDGTASMATAVLMSHHAFRRDIARFATALARIAKGETSRVSAVREEWGNFRGALHGHHMVEDTQMFPSFRSAHPELGPVLDDLAAQHRLIDPLLERGDQAFAALPDPSAASAVIAELSRLLDEHLAAEEASVSHLLRDAKAFPPPPTEAEAALYADGFAWSSDGIAEDVLARLNDMLPGILSSKLPAARAAFALRRERVWGNTTAGTSRTSVPEA